MDNFIKNLRILWRADSAIAEIKFRYALTRSGLHAVAALIAIIGLVMLELAAYFALADRWGAISAAATLGLANFAFAGLLVLIAARQRPDRELELANEIHNSAMEALQDDARLLQAEVSAFGRMVRHPFDSALPALIVPLATLLMNMLRKPKDDAPPKA
jgi:hypothetical protein